VEAVVVTDAILWTLFWAVLGSSLLQFVAKLATEEYRTMQKIWNTWKQDSGTTPAKDWSSPRPFAQIHPAVRLLLLKVANIIQQRMITRATNLHSKSW